MNVSDDYRPPLAAPQGKARSGAAPWTIAFAAVCGLLVAIVIAGLVSLELNRSVAAVVDEALQYDVRLEDLADDLRVAVLDVRHYHRNITFGGPARGAIEDLERAYATVREEIDKLEQLGVRDGAAPAPAELRRLIETYYGELRPAIDRYEADPVAFTRASDHGLVTLHQLEQAAAVLDHLGEQRAAASLLEVEDVATRARLVLLVAVVGLVVAGMGLAYTALRTVDELRRLYAGERDAAEALAAASRTKTDFLADVSHEESRG